MENQDIEEQKLQDKKIQEFEAKVSLISRIAHKTIESVVATIVTTLIVGFFAILWVDRTSIKESLVELNSRTRSAERALKAATETLTRELVKFQTENLDKRVIELEKANKEQAENLDKLIIYLNKTGTDKGKLPEFGKFRIANQPIQQANQVFKEEQRILDEIGKKQDKPNDSNN